MKTILILTAGFGEGHNAAARNIHEALLEEGGENAHVEVLDLLASTYGWFNDGMRRAYMTTINVFPFLWQRIYNHVDKTRSLEKNLALFVRLRHALEKMIQEKKPDVIVCTYPFYNFLLQEIFSGGRTRRFLHVTVVTDSITVNSFWYRAYSDCYVLPNEETAEAMRQLGVPRTKVKVLGFPVQLAFVRNHVERADVTQGGRPSILYMVHAGKKKAPHIIRHLVEQRQWKLTITVGNDEKLYRRMAPFMEEAGDRMEVIRGWTPKIPELLMSHHVLIAKAGGAVVQEAIAARCPMVVNQVVPGQEEGNWELLRRADAGERAEEPQAIAQCIGRAFEDNAAIWSRWQRNISTISKPDSALQIARFLLGAGQT